MQGDPRFLFEPHAGHFLPLFKLAYLAQLYLFGMNVQLFHFVGLSIYALTCGSFLLLVRSLVDNKPLAFFFAALLAVHPVNFVALLWPFQLGILIQLLFQIWAMRVALGGGEQGTGALLFLLLLGQQLSFGNGHFFPLAVSAVLLLFHGSRPEARRLAALAVLLSLSFLFCQYILMREFAAGEVSPLLARWSRYPTDLVGFILLTIARAALILDAMVSKTVARLAAMALLGLALCLSWTDSAFARRLVVVLAWLFTTSAIVPLARADSAEINYYYNTLAIMPTVLFVALLTAECSRRLALQLGPGQVQAWSIAAVILLLTIVFLDQRLVGIFEWRNIKNKQAFTTAMTTNAPYRPFDDPVFGGGPGLQIAPGDAVRAYRYWQQHAVLPDLNRY